MASAMPVLQARGDGRVERRTDRHPSWGATLEWRAERTGRAMKASWLWAAVDLRRRWRAVVLMTTLAGLAGGFALTAFLGARRTASAWPRFRAETLASDAFVSIPSRPDPELADELAAMPGVIDAASFAYAAVTLPAVMEGGAFAATDDRLLRTVHRGRLLEGRRPDPSRADEIVVNPVMASAAGVRAGQRIRLVGVGDSQFSKEVTVVGVLLTDNDLALNTGFPSALLTPAFYKAHLHEVDFGRVNQFVRLEPGESAVASFRDRLIERYGAEGGVLVGDTNEEATGIRNALRLQATALALLAAIAAAASVVAVGQALARHVGSTATDGHTLHALGMTSGERTWGSMATVAVVAFTGAVLAVGTAIAASPLVPTGLARQVELDKGIKVDLVAVGGGGLALAVLVAAAGYGTARRVVRLRGSKPAQPSSRVAAPLSPAATVGLVTAMGPGSRRTRGPTRSAIAAAFFGGLGVAAAATFAASLDHLLETPRLYGWNFDASVGVGGDDPLRIDQAIAGLVADPDVEQIAAHELSFLTVGGRTVETVVLHQQKGSPIRPTLAAGRPPLAPDEIILGATTIDALAVELGDRVEAVGKDGPVPMVVVGEGIFPVMGEGGTTEGAAILPEAASDLRLEESRGRLIMVGVLPGLDAVQVIGRHTDLPTFLPMPPAQIQNLRLVSSAPWLLAAFLAALGTAAVGHALVMSVRAGRRDLAVLKALGFVRRQVHATVHWQASAMVAMGLIPGVPLGMAVGRWVWRLAARSTGALVEPVMAVAVLTAVVAAAFLLANVIAAVPARTAGRTHPAAVLGAE